MTQPIALIAEDEPLLAQSLQSELLKLWPQLQTHVANDGLKAVEMALELLPQLLFFDVRMPGQSGLEAAQDIAERWPEHMPLPQLIFVTAFDEYAVQAFEQAAVDYIVKPVKPTRLKQTLDRIHTANRPLDLMEYSQNAPKEIATTALPEADEPLLIHLRALLRSPPGAAPAPRLQRIQASVGNQIVMVALKDVAYFEAADKYVRVLTGIAKPERELLIRTPIKDLAAQLDSDEFWQIHRSTLVRASLIDTVQRDEAGRLSVTLRGRLESLGVSRLYASLFKAM
jgi:DNA-binding LytR/AlgR family response regulator